MNYSALQMLSSEWLPNRKPLADAMQQQYSTVQYKAAAKQIVPFGQGRARPLLRPSPSCLEGPVPCEPATPPGDMTVLLGNSLELLQDLETGLENKEATELSKPYQGRKCMRTNHHLSFLPRQRHAMPRGNGYALKLGRGNSCG